MCSDLCIGSKYIQHAHEKQQLMFILSTGRRFSERTFNAIEVKTSLSLYFNPFT